MTETAQKGAKRLVAGGAIFFVSSTLVHLGNYVYNLIMGRWLGPEQFAEISLIVTLLLVLTFVTTTLQTTAAKFAAARHAEGDKAGLLQLRAYLLQWSRRVGWPFAALMILGSPMWASFFKSPSVWPYIILGVGIPIYLSQGVHRGILQGRTRFPRLAGSYQAEMWVRLGAAIALVASGLAVNGAVAALTLSFVASWLIVRNGADERVPPMTPERALEIRTFVTSTVALLVGEILINHSDVLIVKHFFEPADAGLYAGLALIGRVVFFATWSIVTVIFPIVAQRHQRGEPHAKLFWMAFGGVAAACVAVVVGAYMYPEPVIQILLGDAYLVMAPLLWKYALATSLFAVANTVVTYELAVGRTFGGVMTATAGGLQVILLWFVHADAAQVVHAQVFLMAAFAIIALGWSRFGSRVETPKQDASTETG